MLKARLVSIFGAVSLIPNSAPFEIKEQYICDATTSHDESKVEGFNFLLNSISKDVKKKKKKKKYRKTSSYSFKLLVPFAFITLE